MSRPASEVALARFHREVERLAALDHPGIIRVIDSGTMDGRPSRIVRER